VRWSAIVKITRSPLPLPRKNRTPGSVFWKDVKGSVCGRPTADSIELRRPRLDGRGRRRKTGHRAWHAPVSEQRRTRNRRRGMPPASERAAAQSLAYDELCRGWDPWRAIPAHYNLGTALTQGPITKPALLWENAK